jgi:hypothetical protein
MAKRTTAQNNKLYLLLEQTGLKPHKAALVEGFTNGRTESSSEMTAQECESLIGHLESEHRDKCKNVKAKVIFLLCKMGFTTANNQPDYERINNFIKNIGSNNPRKVILNFLYYNELCKVCTQVEAMDKNETNRFIQRK